MVTSKSLKNKSSIFGTLNPGASILGADSSNRGNILTFDNGLQSRQAFVVDLRPFCLNYDQWNDENIKLRLVVDKKIYYVDPEDVTEIKIPSLKKDFRAKAVPNSVWRFTQDWVVSGYHKDGSEHLIPKGTTITIKGKKMPRQRYGNIQVISLILEYNETIAKVFPTMDMSFSCLPANEAAQYLELVSEGDAKTYWIIEDNDGKRLAKKRFGNLAAIKSSIRYRIGLTNFDDDLPEWFMDGDIHDDFSYENGLNAVEYDYLTNKKLATKDMLEYRAEHKLRKV